VAFLNGFVVLRINRDLLWVILRQEVAARTFSAPQGQAEELGHVLGEAISAYA